MDFNGIISAAYISEVLDSQDIWAAGVKIEFNGIGSRHKLVEKGIVRRKNCVA